MRLRSTCREIGRRVDEIPVLNAVIRDTEFQPALAHQVKRLDQPAEILVRLDVPGVEHELVVELVPLPHAHHVFLGWLDSEPLIIRVVDHIDFLRRRVVWTCERLSGRPGGNRKDKVAQ